MAFKMKLGNSPLSKKGKLSNFFKGLGKEGTKKRQDAQRAKNEGGLTNFEKRQAAKKAARKGNVKPKAKAKVEKKSTGAATTGNAKEINVKTKNNYDYDSGKNKNIKAPSTTFGVNKSDKNPKKVKTKQEVSADKSKGVKRSDRNKKTKVFKGFTF